MRPGEPGGVIAPSTSLRYRKSPNNASRSSSFGHVWKDVKHIWRCTSWLNTLTRDLRFLPSPPFALFPSAFAKVGPQALLPAFDLEKPTQRDPLPRFSAVSSSASPVDRFPCNAPEPPYKGRMAQLGFNERDARGRGELLTEERARYGYSERDGKTASRTRNVLPRQAGTFIYFRHGYHANVKHLIESLWKIPTIKKEKTLISLSLGRLTPTIRAITSV